MGIQLCRSKYSHCYWLGYRSIKRVSNLLNTAQESNNGVGISIRYLNPGSIFSTIVLYCHSQQWHLPNFQVHTWHLMSLGKANAVSDSADLEWGLRNWAFSKFSADSSLRPTLEAKHNNQVVWLHGPEKKNLFALEDGLELEGAGRN